MVEKSIAARHADQERATEPPPEQLTSLVTARVAVDATTLPTQAVATVFERDVDLLILEELSSSFAFRVWWLGKVGYEDPEHHKFVRAWHSIPDQAGESDLVFIVEDARGQRCAVMIEDKVYAPPQPEQARRYVVRGESGKQKGLWDRYIICLTSSAAYLAASNEASSAASFYENKVTYEEIRESFEKSELNRLDPARAAHKIGLLTVAIEKSRRGFVKVENPRVTRFLLDYWQVATQEFPELNMKKPGIGGDRSGWVYFASPAPGRRLVHKLVEGYVDLLFSGDAGNLDGLRAANKAVFDGPIELEIAHKSAAFRIKVRTIDHRGVAEEQRDQIREGLRGALRLFVLSPLIKTA